MLHRVGIVSALIAFSGSVVSHAYAKETASLTVPLLDQAPALDGVLDDAAWKQAARVTDFIQFQPKEGVPMTEETVAYIGYDSQNLYLAFHAKDSQPQKIRAHLAPRDQAFGDDFVGILLDTLAIRDGLMSFSPILWVFRSTSFRSRARRTLLRTSSGTPRERSMKTAMS